MQQHHNQVSSLEQIQSQISRYSDDLHQTVFLQPDKDARPCLNSCQLSPPATKQDELNAVYRILQDMQAALARDIAELELILRASSPWSVAGLVGVGALPKQEKSELSSKESEVLHMFSKGYTYNEVAELLNCKLATIQTHAKRIYKKLHVHSRSEAIYEAGQLNLIRR